MTDFTTDAPLSRVRSAPPKREYYAYFTLIFLATLPLSCLTWLLGVARTGSLKRKNPIKSAWSQARIITPMIFQG